ncbi:MAG TPA: hypothetical protein VF765_33270 [Polyangiaceae bacterium]
MTVIGLAAALGCSTEGNSLWPQAAPMTFRQSSDAALQTLKSAFYADGNWNMCVPTKCGFLPDDDFDWGADSLTAALYLRWSIEKDSSVVPMIEALDANGAAYGKCTDTSCLEWSDVPLWDSIAGSHEHLVTGSVSSLHRAVTGFGFVDTANQFGRGACPEIDYQMPGGGSIQVKTLETDSNYVKAALLLHQITGTASYLDKAVAKYASVRKWFLDPAVALYTVYVFDDGKTCTPLPHRFYGSVNGNMIWSGVALAAATGQPSFLQDAVATATAVKEHLSDAAGIYADLQTDDDVVEPLIEGMYALATQGKQTFAEDWLLANARAMSGARSTSGLYGRFFDGPPPAGQITEWQANGAFALAFVAGGLWPSQSATDNAVAWSEAQYVADDLSTLPSSIEFTGRAIAVLGTIGEKCCQLGEARVFVDGVETFDRTGIHQNQSNAFGPAPDSILFAWRWPTPGTHTLRFEAGPPDAKDGGPFLHVQGYTYVP